MARRLTFHQLELRTKSGNTTYRFRHGLNIVTGDYATGKSSMFELIKYALGSRSAEIMPDIKRNLESVTLEVTVGENRLQVTRALGSNSLAVLTSEGTSEIWTATQGRNPRAAIQLLTVLDFPVMRLPRRSGPADEPLTFFDLYRYVYLPQADVNSSVAGHANNMVDRKRKAIFEVAYGLIDSEIEDLEVRAAKLKRVREDLRKATDAVRKFMQDTGTPDAEALDRDEESATAALAEAQGRLLDARILGQMALGDDQKFLRQRLGRLRAAANDLESELLALEISIEKKQSIIAQLHLDEGAEIRSAYAVGSLSGLEFSQCPRCLQSVREKAVTPNHCLLCGQSQDLVPADSDLEARIGRLHDQRQEAEELLVYDERNKQLVFRELATIREELYEVAGELEEQAEPDRLLPSLDMSAEAATSRELARGRLRDIERDRDVWSKFDEMIRDIASLEDQIQECEASAKRRRQALEENRVRIVELGTLFDQEVRGLRLAGYQNSGIDEKSYLPVINGDTFNELSVSGARKTLANVSYYLANLTMALADDEILMPSTVILDSPRTSLGNTSGDVHAGWRLYYRMHLLALASRECQVIVADNGLPEIPREYRLRFMQETNVIELSYDRPLLSHVRHPGRESVETVGSPTALSARPSQNLHTDRRMT